MQFTVILLALNIQFVENTSINGSFSKVTSAFGAAKKFLTGTRKAKSVIHQTPLENTMPGAVSVGKSGDGIMKKSVDFLANSALLVGGIGSIYDHFTEDTTPVS